MLFESDMSLVDPRDKKNYYLHETITRRILASSLNFIFSGIGIINVKGLENLSTTGPVILAANHLTNFDVFPMQFAINRPIYYMGKAELFQNPLSDALLRRLGSFPVYRGARDNWAILHSRRVLEAGQVLGIFPEGSRSRGKGLRPGKSGAARLALETGAPVVPMGVDGTQRMFVKFPRRTTVRINLGKPIYPEPHHSPLLLTDIIMYALAELLPENLRGVYSEKARGFDSAAAD
jgi:1-acyl-sn-glycerol-3-phosphate acyltransferase